MLLTTVGPFVVPVVALVLGLAVGRPLAFGSRREPEFSVITWIVLFATLEAIAVILALASLVRREELGMRAARIALVLAAIGFGLIALMISLFV